MPVSKKESALPEFDTASLSRLAEECGLQMIIFFGSRATGKHRPDSDLDVGVWLDEAVHGPHCRPGRQFYRALFAALAGALGNGNLHLVILNHASPLLFFEAARTGKPVYEKEAGFFTAFSIYAAKKHWDNSPLYKMEEIYLENILERKPMVKPAVIRKKLIKLNQYLSELADLAGHSYEEYAGSYLFLTF